MKTFEVNDMTCGHCVGAITKAIKAAAPGAEVRIDLATHCVMIDRADVDSIQLGKAIEDAGYTPVVIDDVIGISSKPAAPARSGCCCG